MQGGDTASSLDVIGRGRHREAPIYEDDVYEMCVTENGIALSIHRGGRVVGTVGIHPPRAVFLSRRSRRTR